MNTRHFTQEELQLLSRHVAASNQRVRGPGWNRSLPVRGWRRNVSDVFAFLVGAGLAALTFIWLLP